MADQLLSALIRIVVQKSTDSLVQRIGEMWGIADQRERLHGKLLTVQAVLTDAEEQGDGNPAVKFWLAKLKSAAYDADDVLDEFHYEELRRDAVRRGHKIGNVSGFFFLENPVLFRYKMSRKLKEVVGKIDKLTTEMERFKFLQGRQERVVDRIRTHSYVIESEVVGRREEKEILVKLLTEVNPAENLMVLPIVGMGGLGKTTLAQLVYNDPMVKEHFNLFVWVCVSEKFDVGPLAKLIIDSVVQRDCNVPCDNMDLLQMRLRQELSGKRYLLVLDDVWNENTDKWEQLRAPLNCGDLGSVILVTTRSGIVASIMGTVLSYNLQCLGEEESWSVFRKRAFGMGVGECEELVEIGWKLVQNCGGLPLAIKTLGSLMSYKHEVHEWLAILEQSTMWENRHANDPVLSVLRLSYDQLPSYMKQCFAFCAVFPKDYVMDKKKLVQCWMANGFIPSDGPGSIEMTGSDIFNELVWRSFFQDVEQVFSEPYCISSEHEYRSQTTCKMHDLMHDLAQCVMGDECLSLLESVQINNKPQCKVRHISLRNFHMDINEAIVCFPAARSLFLSSEEDDEEDECFNDRKIRFVKPNFLRVLDLSVWPFGKTTIILGKMKHLRYLNLSHVSVVALHEAITTLYLLQTLKLTHCYLLEKLPEGMRYMMSLRHLYTEYCYGLKCMPPSLGELKCLQTLTYYIVDNGVGNRIGELKTLNLGGQLEVYNLKEVRDARDAREANMVSKQNLDHLALCWGMPSDNHSEGVRSNGSEAVVVDLEVLDALKPCNKLKVLRITDYRGNKFPIWMTGYHMLEKLVELYIIKCRRCTSVPPLHRLPLLQILHIKFMDNLRHLCCGVFMSAEGGENAPITFPSLKSLTLEELPNLDCWWEGDVGEKTSLIFSVLSELFIFNCPKLSVIPITPILEKMVFKGNNTLSCFASGLTTIRSLRLISRDALEYNADETLSFKPWESLEDLTIIGFNHIILPTDGRKGEELGVDVNAIALQKLHIYLSNFWFSPIPSNSPPWLWKCFTFLEFLEVNNCDSLIYWPEEEFSNLIYLRKMVVFDCMNFLGSLLEPPSEMSTRQVLLPELKNLEFNSCPNMVEVPKLLRSLEKLQISGSTKLECLPEWLGSLVALKELDINKCESLNSLPSSIGCLTALERLWIDGCINLESLPEGMQGLEALKILAILECPKIRILPEDLLQRLRSLDHLWIRGCPILERDFQKHGMYWHLISEISDVQIEEGVQSSKIGALTQLISSCKIPCCCQRNPKDIII